jgi:hypothetical protein
MRTLVEMVAAAVLVWVFLGLLQKILIASKFQLIQPISYWLGLPCLWLVRLAPLQRTLLAGSLMLRLGWQLPFWVDTLVIGMSIFFIWLLAGSRAVIRLKSMQFASGVAINIFVLSYVLRILASLLLPTGFYTGWIGFLLKPLLLLLLDGLMFLLPNRQ